LAEAGLKVESTFPFTTAGDVTAEGAEDAEARKVEEEEKAVLLFRQSSLRGLRELSGENRGEKVPVLPQCPIIYVCRVVHFGDVLPPNMAAEVAKCYPKGDYHRIYFGKILSAVATEDAAGRLA
jgi:hypothetical protein